MVCLCLQKSSKRAIASRVQGRGRCLCTPAWVFLGTCEDEVEELRVRPGMDGWMEKKKLKKMKKKIHEKKSEKS